jgi:signal transduction histidine kinase
LDHYISEISPDEASGNIWNALIHRSELRDTEIEVAHRTGGRVSMVANSTIVWGEGVKIRCALITLHRRKNPLQQDQQAGFTRNKLAYEITIAEAREREKIARGLHDVVGQLHTMMLMKLDELSESKLPADVSGLVADLRDLLKQANKATRATTFDLSNPLVNLLGLNAAIESLGKVFELPMEVESDNQPVPLPEPVLAVLFRVVRELLFNVRKHAHASQVLVSLSLSGGYLMIKIADDGIGFDLSSLPSVRPEGGYGLFSALAQVQSLGGSMEIDSFPQRGTRILISLPVTDELAP